MISAAEDCAMVRVNSMGRVWVGVEVGVRVGIGVGVEVRVRIKG